MARVGTVSNHRPAPKSGGQPVDAPVSIRLRAKRQSLYGTGRPLTERVAARRCCCCRRWRRGAARSCAPRRDPDVVVGGTGQRRGSKAHALTTRPPTLAITAAAAVLSVAGFTLMLSRNLVARDAPIPLPAS